MKSLIKIALLAIVIVLGYNYFYGDQKEQEQAEKIVGKVKDLGSDIKALVMNEREKYDEGKYDNAIDKFSDVINNVKDKISNIDRDKLEEKKKKIEGTLKEWKEKGSSVTKDEARMIERDMEDLFDDLKRTIDRIDLVPKEK